MSKFSKFFITMKVIAGVIGTINLGISTSFLLGKGINYYQLSFVYSLIFAVTLLLEYPSGNLADQFGRKKIYSIGLLFNAGQYFFYATFSHIYFLYVAAIFGGISGALLSGSLEAWLSTEEKKVSTDPKFHKTFGLSRSLSSISSILVSFSIGSLLNVSLNAYYWAVSIMLIILGLIGTKILPDNKGEANKTIDYTKNTFKLLLKNPICIFLSLVLSAAFASYSVFVIYWQPQAQVYGFDKSSLLNLYSIYLIGTALSSYMFSKIARKVKASYCLIFSFIFVSISFGLFSLNRNLSFFYSALFIFGIGHGAIVPLFFNWVSQIIPSNFGASMISLMNLIASIVSIVNIMLIGSIVENYGNRMAVIYGFYLNIVILFIVILIKNKINTWELNKKEMDTSSI